MYSPVCELETKYKFSTDIFTCGTLTECFRVSLSVKWSVLFTAQLYFPSRSLRSASERRFVVPSQRGSKSLSRTFSFTVPGWWNDPNELMQQTELMRKWHNVHNVAWLTECSFRYLKSCTILQTYTVYIYIYIHSVLQSIYMEPALKDQVWWTLI